MPAHTEAAAPLREMPLNYLENSVIRFSTKWIRLGQNLRYVEKGLKDITQPCCIKTSDPPDPHGLAAVSDPVGVLAL